jgi:small subunit ribosomal protein S8
MLSDPISDYLTRLRNGLTSQHGEVEIPASRLKKEMSRILKEQGYIRDYSVDPKPVGETIRIQLKYTEDRKNRTEVPRVLGGMGTAIVSTSRGVMSGHEASAMGVGGEVIAYIW